MPFLIAPLLAWAGKVVAGAILAWIVKQSLNVIWDFYRCKNHWHSMPHWKWFYKWHIHCW